MARDAHQLALATAAAVAGLGALSYAVWEYRSLLPWTRPDERREIWHERNAERKEMLWSKTANPFERIDDPTYHGLAPFSTRNVWIPTADGTKVHAWHVLPHSVYKRLWARRPTSEFAESEFTTALAERPTVLFCHGTGWTIAAPHRVAIFSLIANRLDCNVVAVDYRGYGLSPGVPLEGSCYEDARAAWDWVASAVQAGLPEGKKAQDLIAVVGHSLGGPIGSHLVTQLEAEGVEPRAFAILASFPDIPLVIKERVVSPEALIRADNRSPIFADLRRKLKLYGLSGEHSLSVHMISAEPTDGVLNDTKHDQYNLLSRLMTPITCPVLIAHSTGDEILTQSHFDALCAGFLADREKESSQKLPNGTVISRYAALSGQGKTITSFGPWGNHSEHVGTEVVVDLIGEIMDL